MSQEKTTQDDLHPFIAWVNEIEAEKGWTDNKWTSLAGLSASVLSNARNKGVIPKWDACYSLAVTAGKSPTTAFRKAGLLPPDGGDQIKFEDWQYLLSQLSPEEQEEIRHSIEYKIERRQKDTALKSLHPKKVR